MRNSINGFEISSSLALALACFISEHYIDKGPHDAGLVL
jgi:hypothetical protein